VLPFAAEQRVFLRPTDDQARDDVDDLHPWAECNRQSPSFRGVVTSGDHVRQHARGQQS
jgi:hypothetical protein